VLTVSESKRLIAKGIARHPAILRALECGTISVAKGTTNGYIVEELTGEKIDKLKYCTGVTRPRRGGAEGRTANELPDLVLRKGQRIEGVTSTDALADMGPGDVFIKGCNAINYELQQAGILIGHPTGGTIGAALGTVIARRIVLIHAVGLEKCVPVDIAEAAAEAAEPCAGNWSRLFPVPGEIFTEIEALETLFGVDVIPYAAGGIGGAEGSVRLLMSGAKKQIEEVDAYMETIWGEPPFFG